MREREREREREIFQGGHYIEQKIKSRLLCFANDIRLIIYIDIKHSFINTEDFHNPLINLNE